MKNFDLIFREYDLRGTEKEGLNADFARRLGWAFAAYLRNKLKKESLKVSVGWDARLTSPLLAQNLIGGLLEKGISTLKLEVCPTPLLYFSLFNLEVDGGIMITGSHNPPEYNGFKICLGKETISGREIQSLKRLFYKASQKESPNNDTLATAEKVDIFEKYLSFMKKEFAHLNDYPELKIAVDSGNGTAGLIAPAILKQVGCEVVELFSEPDGNFPNHHPDPTVLTNLKSLQKTVRQKKCDFGVAFDGDADRLGVVDEKGEVVYGDKLITIFARNILEQNPGAKIIGEVKCSQLMYREIERLGGRPIMWKTGHSLIKKKMLKEKALLAGEMSGHFFFADRYFGFDDGIYSALRLTEIFKKERKEKPQTRFSELYANLPPVFSTPEIRIHCPERTKKQLVEVIKEKILNHKQKRLSPLIKDLSLIDGVRIIFEKGWGLLRPSNTQAVLVLRFEGESKEKLKQYQELIKNYFEEAKREVK